MVLGVIFDGFGCPEGSLCGFGGSWSPGGFLMYFGISPWGPRIQSIWSFEGNEPIHGWIEEPY